ncbi:hypothetical protein [Nocardia sp. NPDC052566]|uniref:hypothetical protein n=1 Tax=Nocardia sp. NPDC052566 TaxID=3364330 RepID=UPI0037C7697B
MDELNRREAAARERAEGLRRRIEELSQELVAAEQVLSRLAITRETRIEILGGAVEVVESLPESGGDGAEEPEDESKFVARSGSPIGVIRVPLRGEGMAVSVLPADYRDILEVLTDAGRGLRCAHVVAALGLDAADRSVVESMRPKLKRLTARGWLTEPTPGLYTVADGVEVNG